MAPYLFDDGQQATMVHTYTPTKEVAHPLDLGQVFIRAFVSVSGVCQSGEP